MVQRFLLGNEIISLDSVDSTNSYLKRLILDKNSFLEGITVVTKNQTSGRGQMGNIWLSEEGKNLTFSVALKPKLKVDDQFLISKVVSLGIVEFLIDLGIDKVKIKWPNDIYVDRLKIAGILIENSLKGSSIESSILGIGVNINQVEFSDGVKSATSLKLIKKTIFDLDDLLNKLLFFIEKKYLMLRNSNISAINADYERQLYRLNEVHQFQINNKIIKAKIVGVTKQGKLKLDSGEVINELDLKEVVFI